VRLVPILLLMLALWLAPFHGGHAEPVATQQGTVIVFLDPGCPIARFHTGTLRDCHATFAKLGFRFEGYVANTSVSKEHVKTFATKFEIPFPVHADTEQKKARALDAKMVPEVFVYNSTHKLVYRGRIDDAYVAIGKKRPNARSHDLKRTLQELVKGLPISISQTKPVGCPITYRQPKETP
jgi:hypothetical protein